MFASQDRALPCLGKVRPFRALGLFTYQDRASPCPGLKVTLTVLCVFSLVKTELQPVLLEVALSGLIPDPVFLTTLCRPFRAVRMLASQDRTLPSLGKARTQGSGLVHL